LQRLAQEVIVLLAAHARPRADQEVALDRREARGIIAPDAVQFALQAAVLIVDVDTGTDVFVADRVTDALFEYLAQPLVLVVDESRSAARVGILRQGQQLRVLLGKIASPDADHVASRVTDRL
jgi:hypothetical protein